MKVLTVTIPSYNAENFLRKGVCTMLDNRILDDLEIIIVDDGSTDRTAEISDRFHEQYPDTVRVIHKANGGHGSGINCGIKYATGKYFCVVDADDWVDTENFVKLVYYMKESTADLLLANMVQVDSSDRPTGHRKIKGLPVGREVVLNEYIANISNLFMHNYFIRTYILKEHQVCCHEHLFYVDREYVLYSLCYVKTVTFTNLTVYHYWFGRDGQSVSIERRRELAAQYIKGTDYVIDFLNRNFSRMTQEQCDYYAKRIAWSLSGTYGELLSYNCKTKRIEMEQYDKKLKEQAPNVYMANKNLCIRLLRLSHFKCYKIMAMIYRTVKM